MNKFFIYEGDILRAAQPKLLAAMKYLKGDRDIFWGNPTNPKERNITNIINKLMFRNANN
jgi:hypothetical protein